MRTSAPGTETVSAGALALGDAPAARLSADLKRLCVRGFTLLELLVVVAIMALATAGVGFALRDSSTGDLERDAQRLAALLESARAQSRMSGNPVRWHATSTGFTFQGLPGSTLPERWLYADTLSPVAEPINLGPDPIIGVQNIRMLSARQPDRSLSLVTDGVRPFAVVASTLAAPATR